MIISFIGLRASVAKAESSQKRIKGLDPAEHDGIYDGNVV
jgi:hypothetical protein